MFKIFINRRKKFNKKISNDRGKLASFATMADCYVTTYSAHSQNVLNELRKLKEEFSYTSPNSQKSSSKLINEIEESMEDLKSTLLQESWEEDDVIKKIDNIIKKIYMYKAEGVKK